MGLYYAKAVLYKKRFGNAEFFSYLWVGGGTTIWGMK